MSNDAKLIGSIIAGMLVVLLVGAIAIGILTFLVSWLLPLATAGVFAPGLIQCLAIVVLALLAKVTVFAKK